jgi:transcriptional regulator with XRE-family HTH domain
MTKIRSRFETYVPKHKGQVQIKDWREQFGFSQTELGARIGLSYSAISVKEAGKQPFTVPEFLALAEVFGVDVCWLFALPPSPESILSRSRVKAVAEKMTEEQLNAWIMIGEVMEQKAD